MALDRFFRRRRPQPQAGAELPDLWTQCPQCKAGLYNRELEANLFVCPKCGHHLRLDAQQRVDVLLDEGSFEQRSGRVHPTDPLGFEDIEPYPARLERAQKRTGRPDAILTGTGTIHGIPVTVAVMDFAFNGGSMGSVVGEEIARAAEYAAGAGTPLVLVAASGGARMQESALSLMQMAKTTVALEGLAARGLPYVSILTDPTTGGVTASFATIADVIIAEPGALIGFAGPRVIQQTIRQHLPEGFQRAEFLLEHGMVDGVVDRREHRAYLARLLGVLQQREVSA
ncbi:acetyl-CoA carboxylase, carboxyltransferase subunit beta [Deinococcus sp. YIM 77859]|uniref:acetyl-CoA carboxylase, carboxyltransferase subunit beta n=1 Tax=Deinococcus sp. YIM 77859 TaxID=1540221 RepID=UPI0005563F37|nr:acetyl-CoA carboxylase, carboxyltransferase subunit beta [Deinococcus sp. YIM 77859]